MQERARRHKKNVDEPGVSTMHLRRALPCPHIPHGIHMESICIPGNSRWIPSIPYGICFGWYPTHFGYSIPLLFHMESTWNGHIPSLFHHSIWNVYMESTWNGHGFHMDSISFHGMTMDSIWIPHGMMKY